MNYKKAIEEIKQNREKDIVRGRRLFLNILSSYPEIHEKDIEINTIRQRIRRGEAGLEDTLARLQQEEKAMISQLGFSDDDFFPPVKCKKCNDTGVVDSEPCSCVISLVTASASSSFDISFSDWDFSIFEENSLPYAKLAYDSMINFCAKFPETNKTNIVFMGGVGTGKTFLASCVADRLSEKGFSVVFLSAFGFVNRMLAYHTAPMSEKLDYFLPLIDCDLLIIDDLGTENILKNVTVEYIFNVINERIRQKKHTIITTNLDFSMISERYGQRLASRLMDKRLSTAFSLGNKDARTK
jgi:DNA replication protein DnaC